jgi:hypothetical protein
MISSLASICSIVKHVCLMMPVPNGLNNHNFNMRLLRMWLCVWQLWLRMVVMSFFTLCLVLLWLVGPGWCTSQEFSWLGLMPMQVRSHCIPLTHM